MGAKSESGRAIPAVYDWTPLGPFLIRLLQKNANFTISDLGFPDELGHDLGRFGHLLSLYFARVSLVLRIDPMGRSRFFSISTYESEKAARAALARRVAKCNDG